MLLLFFHSGPIHSPIRLFNLKYRGCVSVWVCSLLLQPPLYPFFCNFYLRFVNLSYSSAWPRLVLSEKYLFGLNNLLHLCPFKHTHLPASFLVLRNTMSPWLLWHTYEAFVNLSTLSSEFYSLPWIIFSSFLFFKPKYNRLPSCICSGIQQHQKRFQSNSWRLQHGRGQRAVL